MEFSAILRELREDSGLTQKELAAACNLSPQCISALEKGINSPTALTLTAIANFFKMSIDELLEVTPADKAAGVGNHPTHLSTAEWEWLELRSEIIEARGEQYLNTLTELIKVLSKK